MVKLKDFLRKEALIPLPLIGAPVGIYSGGKAGLSALGFSGFGEEEDPYTQENLAFQSGNSNDLVYMASALGITDFLGQLQTKIASGQQLAPEERDQFINTMVTLNQMQSGSDEGLNALSEAYNAFAGIQNGDVANPDFLSTLAKFGGRLSGEGATEDTATDDYLTTLRTQQEEENKRRQQEFEMTMMANERAAVTDFLTLLPSKNRLPFMAQLIQRPTFAKMFFGGEDSGLGGGASGGSGGSTLADFRNFQGGE